MGWNISHGTDRNGEVLASYSHMDSLCKNLAHNLPASQWRVLKPAFTLPSERFRISPRDAGRMADVLRTAATHRLMSAEFTQTARDLADAASRAANARQPWEWR
ncbi:DUF7739 domain-containing protein [Streptomyces nigrescens]